MSGPAPVIRSRLRLAGVSAGREGGRRLEADDMRTRLSGVSVVTINYRMAAELPRTMESVLGQLTGEDEYLVVDGASDDGSVEILQRYSSRLSYWVSAPDQGISHAFNRGIGLARGEVIGLLNAGDWYPEGTLDLVRRHFRDHPDTDVLCGQALFWRDGRPVTRCDARPDLLRRDMSVVHPAVFVRARCYRRWGGFRLDYRLAMDYELLLRFFLAGARFDRVPQILACVAHDGRSERRWRDALAETFRARRELGLRSWEASGWYERLLAALRSSRIFLERAGAAWLVQWYRRRLAPVRKDPAGRGEERG